MYPGPSVRSQYRSAPASGIGGGGGGGSSSATMIAARGNDTGTFDTRFLMPALGSGVRGLTLRTGLRMRPSDLSARVLLVDMQGPTPWQIEVYPDGEISLLAKNAASVGLSARRFGGAGAIKDDISHVITSGVLQAAPDTDAYLWLAVDDELLIDEAGSIPRPATADFFPNNRPTDFLDGAFPAQFANFEVWNSADQAPGEMPAGAPNWQIGTTLAAINASPPRVATTSSAVAI